MPTYEYECDACHYFFEHYQSMTDPKLKKCPKCGKNKLYRLIGTGAGVIFKGTGFYETDYKAKPSAGTSSDQKQDAPAAATQTKKDDSGAKPATAVGNE